MTSADKIRAVAADFRTADALGITLVALHGWWFVRSEHKPDVISGFGVAMAVLGILIAAQPLMDVGIERMARRQIGLLSEEREREIKDKPDAVADKAARRLFREEVIGGSLIAVGTLLNGYAGDSPALFATRLKANRRKTTPRVPRGSAACRAA